MHRRATYLSLATLLGLLGVLLLGPPSASASPGVCVFVFIDANGNGEYEIGEEEALDVDVCLVGLEAGETCKRTDDQGAACWVLIPKGQYQVCVETSGDFVNTTAVCRGLGVNADRIEQVFFGIKPVPRDGDRDGDTSIEEAP